jgi:cytochrome c oxidase subunit II
MPVISAHGAGLAFGLARGVTSMRLIGKLARSAVAMRVWRVGAAAAGGVMLAAAWAQLAMAEQPHPWEMGMVQGDTPVRERIDVFHNLILLPIITVITVFVLGLLVYVMWRYNAKRNPTPSKTTHNTLLEVAWTTVPLLILVAIWFPSIKLLYFENRYDSGGQKPDMTLKVTGHQWYWSYEYPDQGDIAFDSNILSDADDIKEHKPRLLGVDNPVVLPVGAKVRVQVTSTDVIHSWYVPSAGVQEYAVIGRTNESWMEFEHTGTFYGQCNQLCGVNHSFMPIEIDVVSKPAFEAWVAQAKKKFARNGSEPGTLHLAAAGE